LARRTINRTCGTISYNTELVHRITDYGGHNLSTSDTRPVNLLPICEVITDIAVVLSDQTGLSIYITFGGVDDYRHVWQFNGTLWQARSDPSSGAATSLLDVQHNVVIDPNNTSTIYVGADIGLSNSGSNWSVLENGLPDAAVFDLQFILDYYALPYMDVTYMSTNPILL
jgi:hypothetical protein